MSGATIEATLELLASSLRDFKERIRRGSHRIASRRRLGTLSGGF